MSTIALIGLGIMGWPMATNLARAGHTVTVTSRSDRRAADCKERGLRWAATTAEAVRDVEMAITVLPDTPDVLEVSAEVLANLPRGGLYIDMSTIDPQATVELHQRAVEAGLSMLDAPVSGGEAGAVEGTLSIMVGGSPDDLDRGMEALTAMGSTIRLVGGPGSGQVVKAANQLVVAGHLQMLAEALSFLSAHGIDAEAGMSVIGAGLGGSTVIDRKTASALADNFSPGFRLSLHHKDLRIVKGAAAAKQLVLPATGLVCDLVQTMVNTGRGDLDHSALVRLSQEVNARHDDR